MTSRYGHALETVQKQDDFLDLIDTNFHRCGLSPPVEPLRTGADRYLAEARYAPDPAGSEELRAEISSWYRRQGWPVAANNLIVTASASESYSHIFSSLLPAGSEVLLPRPGYPLFEEVARRRGLVPRFYSLSADKQWAIDMDSVKANSGPDTSCIVLISPNNPTGAVVPQRVTEQLASVADRCGALLLVDEVFSEFRYSPGMLPRPGALFPDQPVCTINGVSKLFASPDLKVSWIVLSGKEEWRKETEETLQVENDLYLSSSPLSQALATELFRSTTEPGKRLAGVVGERRAAMEAALTEANRTLALDPQTASRGITLAWTPAAGGIHLPVQVLGDTGIDDETLCVKALLNEHLNVHPGYLYGIEEELVLVMSFLPPGERIREGVRRLTRLLSRLADYSV